MRTHENFNAEKKKRLVTCRHKTKTSLLMQLDCLVEDNLHLYEKGNLHNIRNMQESMKVHQNESVVLTTEYAF